MRTRADRYADLEWRATKHTPAAPRSTWNRRPAKRQSLLARILKAFV